MQKKCIARQANLSRFKVTKRIILILFEEFNSLGSSKVYKNDKIDRLSRAIKESKCTAHILILPKSKIKIVIKGLILNPIKFLKMLYTKKLFKVNLLDVQSFLINENIISEECSIAMGIGSPQTVIMSCRSLKIPYVEIQHGLVSEQEVIEQYTKLNKPDFYFAWSEHYALLMEKIGVVTFVIKDFFSDGEVPQSFTSSQERVVLFALSIDLEDGIDPFGSLSHKMKHIIDMSRKVELISVIRFHYRSVGRYGMSAMRGYFQRIYPGIQFSDPSHESSFDAIYRSDIVVTHISAIAIESALQGKMTYIIPDSLSDVSGGVNQRIDPSIYALSNVKYLSNLTELDFRMIISNRIENEEGNYFSEAIKTIVNSI